MRKHRTAAKVDANQNQIVEDLRKIPGLSIELGHDDILVGWQGRTYWYEIKNPEKANKKGEVYPSAIKPDQKRLIAEFKGHYKIVTTTEEILDDIGIRRKDVI
jgi:hypothetical protein